MKSARDDEARGQIKELEAVVDELDHIAVTMCKQKNKLEAENKRLREALDRIESMATIENTEIQKIAREALKEASHES